MKRIILTFVAVTVMLFSTDAQTKKGTILLGAGSQFSDTEWTKLSITPKIGYFIQDGLAIGAMVQFSSDDEYFPNTTVNTVVNGNIQTILGGDPYTLTDNSRTFGVFGRYYAARNLFMEVNLSSSTTQNETFGETAGLVDINGVLTPAVIEEVQTARTQSTHVGFGMGYTLVMREHIAIEPYVHLDLVVDGEEVPFVGPQKDISGTSFIAGVNFSLFF